MTIKDAKKNLLQMKVGETIFAGYLSITYKAGNWLVRNDSTREQALCEQPEQVIEFMRSTGFSLESWF